MRSGGRGGLVTICLRRICFSSTAARDSQSRRYRTFGRRDSFHRRFSGLLRSVVQKPVPSHICNEWFHELSPTVAHFLDPSFVPFRSVVLSSGCGSLRCGANVRCPGFHV